MDAIAVMPGYEAYQDSGVEWIGEIPEHWQVKKAKYLFDEVSERSKTGVEELLSVSHMTGVSPRSEKNVSMFMAEDYSGSKLCHEGDLVMNTMWAWMGALGVSDRGGIVSPSYGVFRQKKTNTFSPVFLEYLLTTTKYIEHYNRVSTGLHSSRLRFYGHMFFEMKLGFPTYEEQLAITNFLDQKTAQIDEAIAIKEKQIVLLKEHKQIIIQKAVTQGLDSTVPMKDSGVDWIGEIPEHWDVKKIKQSGKIINGYAYPSNSFTAEGVRVMKISNIQTMKLDWSDSSYVDNLWLSKTSQFQVFEGDLVFALTRPVISTGIKASLVDSKDAILLNQRNAVFRANKLCSKRWIYLVLLVKGFIDEFEMKIDITGQQPNISTVSIGNISIPMPSVVEQKTIADEVFNQCSYIDDAIKSQLLQSQKLKEYKVTLINSAVTGKIKVPVITTAQTSMQRESS